MWHSTHLIVICGHEQESLLRLGLKSALRTGMLSGGCGKRAERLLTVCSSSIRPASLAAVSSMLKVVMEGRPPMRSIALYVCTIGSL